MRMDKLTSKFQLALQDAQSLALGRDHQFIEAAHLMIAMLDQDGSGVRPLLAQSGVNVNGLRAGLDQTLDKLAQVQGCLLYTSPSPRDRQKSRMPSSA